MELKQGLHFLLFIFGHILVTEGAPECNFPTVFQNSDWWDNTWGRVSFAIDTMTGYAFEPYNVQVDNWECLNTDDFDTEGVLVVRATETYSAFFINWYLYLCLKLERVTDHSYLYYLMHPKQFNTNNYRVYISNVATVNSTDTICDANDISPTEFYQMIVKQGSESEAKVTCPSQLLGQFDYTYQSTTDSSARCTGDTDLWDTCRDGETMFFTNSDPSACDATVPFAPSDNNEPFCLKTVATGSTSYTMVYNSDSSVDNTNSFAFTCFAVNSEGTKASLAPKSCREGQTPTQFPVDEQTTSNVGVLLVMTARKRCKLPDTSCSAEGANDCIDTAECVADSGSSTGFICVCSTFYYISGQTCLQRIAPRESCSAAGVDECVPNGECLEDTESSSDFTCFCTADYFVNNSLCVERFLAGVDCSSITADECLVNGECSTDPSSSSGFSCVCKDTHYESSGNCLERHGPGSTCSSAGADECVANAMCETDANSNTGFSCSCHEQYYANSQQCVIR